MSAGRRVGDFDRRVGGFGRAFQVAGVASKEGFEEGVGVGLAPPLGFQLATLQISSIPNSFGLPSLLVSPYSFACFRSQISSAFFGVLPLSAAGSDVTSFQARTAAASFGA